MDEEEKILNKYGYILDRTLGKGAYGKVKSAYSKELKKEVAIKIIDRTKAPAEFLQKFLPRELEILAILDHPHIVKTYKILHVGSKKLFIVMEMGESGDLLELIKTRGKLPEDICKKLFRQLTLAIKFIHDQNIVHRDLKCENMLLDNDLNLKVTDFGFSKKLEEPVDGQMMLSNTYCGSTAYASPELLQSIPHNPKVNDVWSMGVVLFVMLTGGMPYDESNVKKMLECQKKHAINFPKFTRDKCKGAHDLISRMLDPDPIRRIDINGIIQHPWMQEKPKSAQSTGKQLNRPSTSKADKENSRLESTIKKAPLNGSRTYKARILAARVMAGPFKNPRDKRP